MFFSCDTLCCTVYKQLYYPVNIQISMKVTEQNDTKDDRLFTAKYITDHSLYFANTFSLLSLKIHF